MAKKVSLMNGRSWRTQADALAHFKTMLARYQNGETVTDASDRSDLEALLVSYDTFLAPGDPPKVGAGISHFVRERNADEGWSTDGFHVHRIDGTSIDFSYIKAVRYSSK